MRNGIIVGYTVFYRESDMLPDEGYLSVNTTASSVALVNLTVFTEYSVKVAAFTSVGLGNESEVKTVVTQEGGNLLHFLLSDFLKDETVMDWIGLYWSLDIYGCYNYLSEERLANKRTDTFP